MKFPDSYHKYRDIDIQWIYLYGKFETGVFFHCVFFNVLLDGKKRTSIHSSLHTPEAQYYETTDGKCTWDSMQVLFDTDIIRLNAEINTDYFKREISDRTWHCNPNIKIYGRYLCNGEWTDILEADGWAEEEYSNKNWAGLVYEENNELKVNNWDWIGVKLNDSRSIVVYNTQTDNYCAVMDGNKVQKINEYELVDNVIYLDDINMKVTLQPIAVTKRFIPILGMEYSEQPMKVVVGGTQAGFAMREKTYG